ncbi:hypothetical protein B0H14DRAFT_2944600 [Mycena olivaceomarginata]|nr:hypothetical protein B0H14DRAFT_2944600 [Mycena olivaceomarginata]
MACLRREATEDPARTRGLRAASHARLQRGRPPTRLVIQPFTPCIDSPAPTGCYARGHPAPWRASAAAQGYRRPCTPTASPTSRVKHPSHLPAYAAQTPDAAPRLCSSPLERRTTTGADDLAQTPLVPKEPTPARATFSRVSSQKEMGRQSSQTTNDNTPAPSAHTPGRTISVGPRRSSVG